MNKDYDYFLVDIFYQDKRSDPFSTRIFLYALNKDETNDRYSEKEEDEESEVEFMAKKSYFEKSEPVINKLYSSESIFDPKMYQSGGLRNRETSVTKKKSRISLVRIFTYLSEDPLKSPFLNIDVNLTVEKLKDYKLSNPTYTTLGKIFQNLIFFSDFWKQREKRYSALMWEDSKKPSFFLMEFLEKKNGNFEGKIVRKDFINSHILVHYSKLGNALVYVDALGFLHFVVFRDKKDKLN